MKNIFIAFFTIINTLAFSQEFFANVQINHSQLGGSNTQTYRTLEKSLREFINNTSWTGKKLQNFEKIKCSFAVILNGKEGSNKYNASLVVQAVRPVYGSSYETTLVNINDTNFSFEYNENENLIFNERQFSGKNLTDVISFYIYTILGYDGDSFAKMGGQEWFNKAHKISQNSQNQRYSGWNVNEGMKTRGQLIDNILKQENTTLRNVFYTYHRNGLDQLFEQNQTQIKKNICDTLLQLKNYENNFQLNYPFNVFIDAKKEEIYNIFSNGSNGGSNISELKNLLTTIAPKDLEKWNKLK